jgi:DHA3 family macrolide efflux protein-like MFS transporter
MSNQVDTPAPWKLRFFTVWTGQAFSLVGSAFAQFALVWWLTASTGSATVLATATLVAMLPNILLGPVAGALVDRWNRRAVMIVADSAIAALSLWLAYVFATGAMQIWHVYVVMLARSVGGVFHWPAMQASTSLLVPEKQLSRVAGINQTLNGIVSIGAPPMAALLLALLPLHGIMLIDVVTGALAVGTLLCVTIPQPVRAAAAPGAPQTSLKQDLAAGFRYVWAWPGLLALLALGAVLNFLLNPAGALMPILVTRHFGGQAPEIGWMEASWGVGVIAGGLLLGVWGGFRKRMLTTMIGLAGMGLGTLLVGLAPANLFLLGIAGFVLTGCMNSVTNGPLQAMTQSVVAPEMQGRVFTLMASLSAVMAPLGMAIAGPLSDAVGVQVWYVVAGAVCILMVLAASAIPAIRNLEESGKAMQSTPAASLPAAPALGTGA